MTSAPDSSPPQRFAPFRMSAPATRIQSRVFAIDTAEPLNRKDDLRGFHFGHGVVVASPEKPTRGEWLCRCHVCAGVWLTKLERDRPYAPKCEMCGASTPAFDFPRERARFLQRRAKYLTGR